MTGHDSGTVSVFTLSDTSSLNNHNGTTCEYVDGGYFCCIIRERRDG